MKPKVKKTRTRFSWLLKRLAQQIWFRAALLSLGGVLMVALSALASSFITHEFQTDIGQASVGTILEVMASSMLAVTTFSLTTMVTAYGSATQNATPRATQLLVNDTASQNAISTFLGAFVFSIVGIIGLQTEIYGSQGRMVLFGGTVLVVATVVVTLLRWISHLATFGRMADVIDRVEDAATSSMQAFLDEPHLGGRPAVPVPPHARPLWPERTGYVNHLDVGAVARTAEAHGLTIHVAAIPGTLVHPARPLLHCEGALDDDAEEALREAFTIDRHRTFDQDPRLGLIALSEIGSRALAPATNDPGTAIEVLNAMLRVLILAGRERDEAPDAGEVSDRVHVARPSIEDFLDDAFTAIVREGANEAEVAVRMAKMLAALHETIPSGRRKIEAIVRALSANAAAQPPTSGADGLFDACMKQHWPRIHVGQGARRPARGRD